MERGAAARLLPRVLALEAGLEGRVALLHVLLLGVAVLLVVRLHRLLRAAPAPRPSGLISRSRRLGLLVEITACACGGCVSGEF